MIIPKTLTRVLNKHINIEKNMFQMMKSKTYEHTPEAWFVSNQACFIAGMQHALEIVENPIENDILIIHGENLGSNTKKNISKIFTRCG